MGYTWRANEDGTSDAVECVELAEVVYGDDETLVVNLATELPTSRDLEEALVDAIARNERRSSAELAIATLAEEFGLIVHPEGEHGIRQLTLAPPAHADTGRAG